MRRGGRLVPTGIWKVPVDGRVAVRGVNIEGDEQADRAVHGGPDKAVYAYAREDTDWWERELGRELRHGAFGENLTLTGVYVSGALQCDQRLLELAVAFLVDLRAAADGEGVGRPSHRLRTSSAAAGGSPARPRGA